MQLGDATPLKDATKPVDKVEPQNSCNLILNMKNYKEEQKMMDSNVRKLIRQAMNEFDADNISLGDYDDILDIPLKLQTNKCNIILTLQPQALLINGVPKPIFTPVSSTSTEKPISTSTLTAIDEADEPYYDPNMPLYEQQLAVWPADLEDLADAVQNEEEVPMIMQDVPQYEEQMIVYPEINLEEDILAPQHHHEQDHHNIENTAGTNTEVTVLENTHIMHSNGTGEYK